MTLLCDGVRLAPAIIHLSQSHTRSRAFEIHREDEWREPAAAVADGGAERSGAAERRE